MSCAIIEFGVQLPVYPTQSNRNEILKKIPINSTLWVFLELKKHNPQQKFPELLSYSLKERLTKLETSAAKLHEAQNTKLARQKNATCRAVANTVLLAGIPTGLATISSVGIGMIALTITSLLGYMGLGSYSSCIAADYDVHTTLRTSNSNDDDGMIPACTGFACGPCIAATEVYVTIPKHIHRLEVKTQALETSLKTDVAELKTFCEEGNANREAMENLLKEKINKLRELVLSKKTKILGLTEVMIEFPDEKKSTLTTLQKDLTLLEDAIPPHERALKELKLVREYIQKNLLTP